MIRSFVLASLFLLACGSSAPSGGSVGETGEDLSARSRVPWCNSDHTADDEEGDFNGYGGWGCTDEKGKEGCAQLGGEWCKGYVDQVAFLCACKDKRAH